ncbi:MULTISPECIES: hypothetical protein [unclassified Duganella]|uniref:hypothetical protein n=1 Tax=unclassified Duganella TaxID=2636909 RepID=UPI0012E3D61F|nr:MULTISPECIES: hypothetical protein [unclassified Duganella]
MSAIRTARIWHCRYRSLTPISGMINVEELVIGTWPDSPHEVLSRMSRLRYLSKSVPGLSFGQLALSLEKYQDTNFANFLH